MKARKQWRWGEERAVQFAGATTPLMLETAEHAALPS